MCMCNNNPILLIGPPGMCCKCRGAGGRGGRSILGNELNYFPQVRAGGLGNGAIVFSDRAAWSVLNGQRPRTHPVPAAQPHSPCPHSPVFVLKGAHFVPGCDFLCRVVALRS